MDNEYRELERERLAAMGVMRRNWENARLDRLAGIYRPAFGRYQCRDCPNQWVSWAAWRQYGQACVSCANRPKVQPDEVHAIHFFWCRPCDRVWRDTNIAPRMCPDCGVEVASSGVRRPVVYEPAVILDPELDGENELIGNTTKPHKMNLCAKCEELNRGRVAGRVECCQTYYWGLQGVLGQAPAQPVENAAPAADV